mgnify:CR=1 FL=1
MNLDSLTAYKLVKKEKLNDIRSTGYLFRHIKTGARVMAIENDDETKSSTLHSAPRPKTAPVWLTFSNTVFCVDRRTFR